MSWKLRNGNIMLTCTDLSWERELEGVKQVLTVVVFKDQTMTLLADESWGGKTLRYKLNVLETAYISAEDGVSQAFRDARFNGDRLK